MNFFLKLFGMLLMILIFTSCQKNKYNNAAKKIIFFKGKNLICKGKIVNKYNSKIFENNVYRNGKIITNLKNCKVKK